MQTCIQTCIQIYSWIIFIRTFFALPMFHQNMIRKLNSGSDYCRVSSRISSYLRCGN
jgi:hypothetical protein